jgi:hypothetical protein
MAVSAEIFAMAIAMHHCLIVIGVFTGVYHDILAIRGVLTLVQLFTLQPHTIV